jgi:NAD/NADP transhydrogenase beta subunit
LFFGCALALGILMTLPIGGADMPVVISIYNAFTGLAVGLEGFVLQNPALMIAGMVVGAAGMLLTLLMAKAMNRSVSNVLFHQFRRRGRAQAGQDQGQPQAHTAGRRRYRDALCERRDHRAGLRPRGLAGSGKAVRIRQAAADGRRVGEVRGSSR